MKISIRKTTNIYYKRVYAVTLPMYKTPWSVTFSYNKAKMEANWTNIVLSLSDILTVELKRDMIRMITKEL